MEGVVFNGKNVGLVKDFAGDACELWPVKDDNGVVLGYAVMIKTTDGFVRLKLNEIIVKDDANIIHICKEFV